MNLAIVTVRRPGGHDFVHQSLLSLLAVGRHPGAVHVFAGAGDSGHLDYLAGAPRVALHRMDAAEWGAIAAWPLPRRQSYACCKALDHFRGRGEGVCLCEDDILYDAGFGPKLGEAIAEVEATTPDHVLTLYSDRDFADWPGLRRGRCAATYPTERFYGAQAVYFAPAAVGDFAAYLRREGVDRDGPPTDLLLRLFCQERGHLFFTTPSLVQHIGRVSVSGAGFHTSPSFGRPWPPARPDAPEG